MKIGFSFGRCIRDIVKGDVDINDVAFIITATAMRDREHIKNVILNYMGEPEYLYRLDEEKCLEVAYMLWDSNRLLQPRLEGIRRHMQPESSIWVDIYPTHHSNKPAVKKAWDTYRMLLQMSENVDNEATDVFKKELA